MEIGVFFYRFTRSIPGFAVGKIVAKTYMAKLFYQMVGSHRKKFF